MAVTVVKRLTDLKPVGVKGTLKAYDRPAGSAIWRPVLESENVILDQFYVDLFGQVGPEPPLGMSLIFAEIALGYGDSPVFDRQDIGLMLEWTDTFAKLTGATGVGAITTLSITPAPYKILSGETLELGGLTGDAPVLSGDLSIGDTTANVVSFTPSHNWAIGTSVGYENASLLVPQRPPASINIVSFADPPFCVISYFLPASANFEPVKFTEAGLVYNVAPPTTAGTFGSHVPFDYTKDGNTDLRIDYTLARESDE